MREVFLPENAKIRQVVNHTFEFGDYYIEIVKTIFGGRRICVRERDDSGMNYLVNWCAGSEQVHAQNLVGLAQKWIDADCPKFPFSSEPKPYFKDPNFCDKMNKLGFEPYLFTFS